MCRYLTKLFENELTNKRLTICKRIYVEQQISAIFLYLLNTEVVIFFMLRQNRNKTARINRVYYSKEKLFFYSAKTISAISFFKWSKTKPFAVDKTTYLKLSREKLMPLIQPSRHSNAKSLGVMFWTSEKKTISVF